MGIPVLEVDVSRNGFTGTGLGTGIAQWLERRTRD